MTNSMMIAKSTHGTIAILKDELDILIADAKVKRQSLYKGVLARIGDILISIGNSMKERDDNLTSTPLSPLTRQRNETIFE